MQTGRECEGAGAARDASATHGVGTVRPPLPLPLLDGPIGSSANRTFFMPPRRCRRRRSCSTPMSNAVGLEPAIRVVRDEDEARRRQGQGHQAPCSCRAPSRQAGCPSFLFPTTTPTTRSELRTSALATVSSIQLVYLRGESHF
jgi:hypothetical protein